jgi:hypothetical protein
MLCRDSGIDSAFGDIRRFLNTATLVDREGHPIGGSRRLDQQLRYSYFAGRAIHD